MVSSSAWAWTASRPGAMCVPYASLMVTERITSP
jgi:hypothetical protein